MLWLRLPREGEVQGILEDSDVLRTTREGVLEACLVYGWLVDQTNQKLDETSCEGHHKWRYLWQFWHWLWGFDPWWRASKSTCRVKMMILECYVQAWCDNDLLNECEVNRTAIDMRIQWLMTCTRVKLTCEYSDWWIVMDCEEWIMFDLWRISLGIMYFILQKSITCHLLSQNSPTKGHQQHSHHPDTAQAGHICCVSWCAQNAISVEHISNV